MEKEILKRKRFSNHPEDHYLEVVLAKIDNNLTPYVTWEYNKQDGGFYHGHYFEEHEEAKKDYDNRGIFTIDL